MVNNQEHRSIGKSINQLSRLAQIYFQSNFKKYSIGHAQISTLLNISKNNGISQIELSNLLELDKSSMTSQLVILEKNGYICRKVSKSDRRFLNVYLTEKSKELIGPLSKIFTHWTEILLDGFDEQETDMAFSLLEKMHKNATEEISTLKQ